MFSINRQYLSATEKMVRVLHSSENFHSQRWSQASLVAQQVETQPAYSAGDTGDVGSIPGSGRSPGEGNGNPLQYSCQEKPTDRGIVRGVTKESDMTATNIFTLWSLWVSSCYTTIETHEKRAFYSRVQASGDLGARYTALPRYMTSGKSTSLCLTLLSVSRNGNSNC